MKYKTTELADDDISEIYVRGAKKFGIKQAEKYESELLYTLRLLADNPFMARERTEFKRPVRFHPYKSHLIIYSLQDDGVLIVRVLHGKQDIERWIKNWT